jgi:hypothetical protein
MNGDGPKQVVRSGPPGGRFARHPCARCPPCACRCISPFLTHRFLRGAAARGTRAALAPRARPPAEGPASAAAAAAAAAAARAAPLPRAPPASRGATFVVPSYESLLGVLSPPHPLPHVREASPLHRASATPMPPPPMPGAPLLPSKRRYAVITCEDEPKWTAEAPGDLWEELLREGLTAGEFAARLAAPRALAANEAASGAADPPSGTESESILAESDEI